MRRVLQIIFPIVACSYFYLPSYNKLLVSLSDALNEIHQTMAAAVTKEKKAYLILTVCFWPESQI